jgi:hypothetical protein
MRTASIASCHSELPKSKRKEMGLQDDIHVSKSSVVAETDVWILHLLAATYPHIILSCICEAI